MKLRYSTVQFYSATNPTSIFRAAWPWGY